MERPEGIGPSWMVLQTIALAIRPRTLGLKLFPTPSLAGWGGSVSEAQAPQTISRQTDSSKNGGRPESRTLSRLATCHAVFETVAHRWTLPSSEIGGRWVI